MSKSHPARRSKGGKPRVTEVKVNDLVTLRFYCSRHPIDGHAFVYLVNERPYAGCSTKASSLRRLARAAERAAAWLEAQEGRR